MNTSIISYIKLFYHKMNMDFFFHINNEKFHCINLTDVIGYIKVFKVNIATLHFLYQDLTHLINLNSTIMHYAITLSFTLNVLKGG